MRLIERGQKEFDAIDEIQRLAFEKCEQAPEPALRFLFENGDVFVHRVLDGMIVAFAIVTMMNGQPFLRAIATAPSWQKQGIASRLLKEVIEFYEGREYIDLTVRSDNPAQKLYFDYGFRVKQVLRNYYCVKGTTPNYDTLYDGLRMRRIL